MPKKKKGSVDAAAKEQPGSARSQATAFHASLMCRIVAVHLSRLQPYKSTHLLRVPHARKPGRYCFVLACSILMLGSHPSVVPGADETPTATCASQRPSPVFSAVTDAHPQRSTPKKPAAL
jgi:hypothetical protein